MEIWVWVVYLYIIVARVWHIVYLNTKIAVILFIQIKEKYLHYKINYFPYFYRHVRDIIYSSYNNKGIPEGELTKNHRITQIRVFILFKLLTYININVVLVVYVAGVNRALKFFNKPCCFIWWFLEMNLAWINKSSCGSSYIK